MWVWLVRVVGCCGLWNAPMMPLRPFRRRVGPWVLGFIYIAELAVVVGRWRARRARALAWPVRRCVGVEL